MDPTQIPIRDLHLPDPVGWWPLAPGWWVLIVLFAVGLFFLARLAWRHYRENAARRHALQQLEKICREYTRSGDAITLGIELSELLRRTMLAYAPRAEVAGLTGDDWLAWLDQGLDRPHFMSGDGRPLAEWPYRKPGTEVDRSDVGALVDAVRLRLATPLEATR